MSRVGPGRRSATSQAALATSNEYSYKNSLAQLQRSQDAQSYRFGGRHAPDRRCADGTRGWRSAPGRPRRRGMGGQAITPPTCPANGYGAQAYYGVFGQNGGDGQHRLRSRQPVHRQGRARGCRIDRHGPQHGARREERHRRPVQASDGTMADWRRHGEAHERRVPHRVLHPGDARSSSTAPRPTASR